MSKRRFRVGIVGLQPNRSWAARAHVPALQFLADDYEIAGVANTSYASAQAAAAATGLPRAFKDFHELVTSPDVDIVAVTVRVPHHFEIVSAAIEAGKHIFCEWPLGNGLAEAEQLTARAAAKGVLGVVGLQAPVAPEILYLKQLIAEGYAGDILSTTLVGTGNGWGASFESERASAYLYDRANGATLLTIPIAHTLAALQDVLGDIAEVAALITNRRHASLALDTNATIPMTAPDQVLLQAQLASGAPMSLHYRGGMPRDGKGFTWEINGTEADLRITGPWGHSQLVPLSLFGGRGDDRELHPLEVPATYRAGAPEEVRPGNIARLYIKMAEDLRTGSSTAPTFADAVQLHRLIAAIELSAEQGRRVPYKRS